MFSLMLTGGILLLLVVLLVLGFSLIQDSDSGQDFPDPDKNHLAYKGCSLIIVAFIIIGIFVYKAIG